MSALQPIAFAMLHRWERGGNSDALFTLHYALDHVGIIGRLAMQGMADTLLNVRHRQITTPMNNKIDIKSALIGLCVGVVAMLAIGASLSPPLVIGRYQLGGTASHAAVIDTATGQVWSKYLPQESGFSDADFAKPKIGDKK